MSKLSTRLKQSFAAVALSLAAIVPTVAQDTPQPPQTKQSQTLRAMETEMNNFGGSARIVVIDYDAVMMSRLRENETMSLLLKKQIEERNIVLKIRYNETGIAAANDLPPNALLALRKTAVLRNDAIDYSKIGLGKETHFDPVNTEPNALRAEDTADQICLVVPQTIDSLTKSISKKYSGSGRELRADVEFTPKAQFLRATYHEGWHCADNIYLPRLREVEAEKDRKPLLYASAFHKTEMFAETASALMMASKGYIIAVEQEADLRALSSRINGSGLSKGSRRSDLDYYLGAVYYLTPAIEAVLAHVAEQGIDKVKSYIPADIRRVAIEITERNALTDLQIMALSDHLARGKAPNEQDLAVFIQKYDARTDKAIHRMLEKTSGSLQGQNKYEDLMIDKIWARAEKEEREEITAEFSKRLATQNPESAFASMMDDLRDQLHAEKDIAKAEAIERKITLMRIAVDADIFKDMIWEFERPLRTARAMAPPKNTP